ncbi:hypothetical protein RB623_06965 [Mesorhizobium sp. LHD-90]|uniref:hypothetical protein n=1 Tax=Mesorhizobium sp. LHD-90 TaxID=3071414 RepID=UPI0027DF4120|nr:hypothetical protein [Mesorhizobium sp. LHD-90]MDQ6433792.1 hypothetical protein [Mesorhizobium sp. LHD-90]
MDKIATDGITVAFNRQGGVIDELVIEPAGGAALRPLHKAPWVRDGEILPDHVAPVERRLAGDFFCAPFGRRGDGLPIHGWAANGEWESAGTETAPGGTVTAAYRLRQDVDGARLTKRISLHPGHPIVYQQHEFEGGNGRLPVAHHAMLHVPGGARLSFSKKIGGGTPAAALEPDPSRGRSVLAYPQTFENLSSVRRANGETVDASFYTFDQAHEDLVLMTEDPGAKLGWSAALAEKDGFLFFAVKDAALLPQTILWMSNGGRNYSPWNGRHRAVIGIEEGAADLGIDPARPGIPPDPPSGLTLAPGRTTAIRYAFGAIAAPAGWTRVADIFVEAGKITLADASGDTRTLPFLDNHFAGSI